jgi:hypothetical protein
MANQFNVYRLERIHTMQTLSLRGHLDITGWSPHRPTINRQAAHIADRDHIKKLPQADEEKPNMLYLRIYIRLKIYLTLYFRK